MAKNKRNNTKQSGTPKKSNPKGRRQIIESFKLLLETKDFNSITISDIASNAGVTEALIYKYFKDKRDLMYQILGDYLADTIDQAGRDIKGIKGALNKLRKLIWSHINTFENNKVFGRILMLETRSLSGYYESDTYKLARDFAGIFKEVISEGIENGEIRNDLSSDFIMRIIFGSIEYLCLTGVLFGREINGDDITDKLCDFVFKGLAPGT